MPFVSKKELERIKKREWVAGASKESLRLLSRSTPAPRRAVSHLDALDLVIDQFGLREHYKNGGWGIVGKDQSGAEQFYIDLKTAAEFNEKADAAARIEHAREVAGLDAALGLIADAENCE